MSMEITNQPYYNNYQVNGGFGSLTGARGAQKVQPQYLEQTSEKQGIQTQQASYGIVDKLEKLQTGIEDFNKHYGDYNECLEAIQEAQNNARFHSNTTSVPKDFLNNELSCDLSGREDEIEECSWEPYYS